MSPKIMRQFWSLIEATQADLPLSLDDNSLIMWIMREVGVGRSLNSDEATEVSSYIHARLPLIRDLAQQNL